MSHRRPSARLDVTRVNTPRNIEETDRFKDKVLGGQGVASDKPCDGQSPGKEGAAVLIQLSTKKQDKSSIVRKTPLEVV